MKISSKCSSVVEVIDKFNSTGTANFNKVTIVQIKVNNKGGLSELFGSRIKSRKLTKLTSITKSD